MDNNFTESIFYQVDLTARYFKFMGMQIFEKLNIQIPIEEFFALDIISCNEEMCQRDLAKILLRDRANTGKILTSIEKKGYIERIVDTKNNRLIKKIIITDSGKKIVEEINAKTSTAKKLIEEVFTKETEEILITTLKNIRKKLSTVIETQI